MESVYTAGEYIRLTCRQEKFIFFRKNKTEIAEDHDHNHIQM